MARRKRGYSVSFSKTLKVARVLAVVLGGHQPKKSRRRRGNSGKVSNRVNELGVTAAPATDVGVQSSNEHETFGCLPWIGALFAIVLALGVLGQCTKSEVPIPQPTPREGNSNPPTEREEPPVGPSEAPSQQLPPVAPSQESSSIAPSQ